MNLVRIASAALALALVTGAAGATSVTNTDKTLRHLTFARIFRSWSTSIGLSPSCFDVTRSCSKYARSDSDSAS